MENPIKLRRFDFYPADYLEGISDLTSATQIAVYTVAFVTMYARSGPIPNDARWLAQMAKVRRVSDCQQALDVLVAKGKLRIIEGNMLVNGRFEREQLRNTDRVQKLRDNGRHGGRPRRPDLGAISSRSRRDLGAISSRSPTGIVENQPLRKPNGFHQPSTINHQPSSHGEISGEPARAAEPSLSLGPAHGTPPVGRLRRAPRIAGNETGQSTPEQREQFMRDLGVEPGAVATPPPPAANEPAPAKRAPTSAELLAEKAAAARRKLMGET